MKRYNTDSGHLNQSILREWDFYYFDLVMYFFYCVLEVNFPKEVIDAFKILLITKPEIHFDSS